MAWRLEEHSSEHRLRCRYSIYDDMRPVAYAFELSEARKLAAALAMLEALKVVRDATSDDAKFKAWSMVHAAIAAAEPETEEDQKAEVKDELTMMPLASITPVPHPKPEADKP